MKTEQVSTIRVFLGCFLALLPAVHCLQLQSASSSFFFFLLLLLTKDSWSCAKKKKSLRIYYLLFCVHMTTHPHCVQTKITTKES